MSRSKRIVRSIARLIVLIAVVAFALPVTLHAAEAKNIRVSQVGNRILWEYDLAGKPGESEGEVGLTLTIREKVFGTKDLSLEGDFGKVPVGQGKKLWWNLLKDFPRGLVEEWEWDLVLEGADAFTDSVTGMEFVAVKGGCFQMGDTFGDGGTNEKPVHEVCVSDFSMGKTEVTRGQFRKFIDATGYRTDAEKEGGCVGWTGSKWEKRSDFNWRNVGFTQDDRHPMVCVSHNDATEFASWLSRQGSGRRFRLPTEAEWEYAARSGGKKEKYAGGSSESGLARIAWNGQNSGMSTHPVGQKQPNGLGLYDMTGNAWEWCSDWYGEDYYGSSPKNDPPGPASGPHRARRGGSWVNRPVDVRASNRSGFNQASRTTHYGLRLVFSPHD